MISISHVRRLALAAAAAFIGLAPACAAAAQTPADARRAALRPHHRHRRGEQGLRPDHRTRRLAPNIAGLAGPISATPPASTARSIPARPTMSPCSVATPSASTTTTPSTASRPASDPTAPGAAAAAMSTTPSPRRTWASSWKPAGLSWKGYYESLPAPGSLAVIASDPAFRRRHPQDRPLRLQALRLHQLRLGAARPRARGAYRRLRPAGGRPGRRPPCRTSP